MLPCELQRVEFQLGKMLQEKKKPQHHVFLLFLALKLYLLLSPYAASSYANLSLFFSSPSHYSGYICLSPLLSPAREGGVSGPFCNASYATNLPCSSCVFLKAISEIAIHIAMSSQWCSVWIMDTTRYIPISCPPHLFRKHKLV